MRLPLAFLLSLIGLPSFPAELVVPARVGAIAEALENANSGDTLLLSAGTYSDNVVLDKPVTLDGQGHATIDGGDTGTVVLVTVPVVVV